MTTTASSATFTEYVKPEPIKIPPWGEWPVFKAPRWCRNGREAGAFLVGVVTCIPEKLARVTVHEDQAAGATHAMIEGGLIVQAFSRSDADDITYEVRSAHHEFVD